MTSEKSKVKTGIYKVTKGEYQGAELIVTNVESPEESEFVYLTIYNPGSDENHEIELSEWLTMTDEDGLKWDSAIPNDIIDKDQL